MILTRFAFFPICRSSPASRSLPISTIYLSRGLVFSVDSVEAAAIRMVADEGEAIEDD